MRVAKCTVATSLRIIRKKIQKCCRTVNSKVPIRNQHATEFQRGECGMVEAMRRSDHDNGDARGVMLSFDVEDWNRIMGARVGQIDGPAQSAAFERQMQAIFELLDQTGWKATFFLLGTTLERHPEIAREIARRNDEIASHGYRHEPVYRMSPDAFRRDLEKSIEIIDKFCGKRPLGYRAPYFSINRDCVWAYELIAELGFVYDSSQYDSPWVHRRLKDIPTEPYRLRLPSGRDLIEMPLSVWKMRRMTIPIGGGSYWRVLPKSFLALGLRESSRNTSPSALYFHPYECDPDALHLDPDASATGFQHFLAAYWNIRFNVARRWLLPRIRQVLSHFEVTTYIQTVQRIRPPHEIVQRRLSCEGWVD